MRFNEDSWIRARHTSKVGACRILTLSSFELASWATSSGHRLGTFCMPSYMDIYDGRRENGDPDEEHATPGGETGETRLQPEQKPSMATLPGRRLCPEYSVPAQSRRSTTCRRRSRELGSDCAEEH
ncbi:hypothetical protein HPB50_015366 [Hyalomma asiaticum]|uniref:Uncharacterized protein n=1 Tax=Hyalomma asiaticum TaxID=266040 RepID=A0ACB7THZ3_HYAAI|nr:hypothetical protein HPB50_015366 [Hyalomma asiaticum]